MINRVVSYPGIIWSACNLNFSMFKGEYQYCIVFIIPYDEIMPMDTYEEEYFYKIHIDGAKMSKKFSNELCTTLDEEMIDWFVPPLRTDHDINLTGTINNKWAATRAGLGWIGKNNLLITPEYGPQINIFGLLTDEDVKTGVPVDKSYCGDCDLCVKNCLFHTIKGADWKPGVGRDDQVDYRRCHDGKNTFRKKLGRKLGCGKCMVSCPAGKKAGRKSLQLRQSVQSFLCIFLSFELKNIL